MSDDQRKIVVIPVQVKLSHYVARTSELYHAITKAREVGVVQLSVITRHKELEAQTTLENILREVSDAFAIGNERFFFGVKPVSPFVYAVTIRFVQGDTP